MGGHRRRGIANDPSKRRDYDDIADEREAFGGDRVPPLHTRRKPREGELKDVLRDVPERLASRIKSES